MSSSKRHFTIIFEKEIQSGTLSPTHGLYISSTPSSAARKAVSKLYADNKKKKVEFSMRETTQGSNKKIYGPYIGYMQKLDKPVELEGRVIRYKPIVKLHKKGGKMKGGRIIERGNRAFILYPAINTKNPNHISKIIHFDNNSEVQNFVSLETRLNEIDPKNRYQIPFVSIKKIIHKEEPTYGNIPEYNYERWLEHHMNDLNSIKELIGNQNFQRITNEYDFKFNYLVTVEYGGIPIYQFINGRYNVKNESDFIKILLGIVNIFNGILHFYEHGVNNCSITDINILFLPHDPSNMRILNFKNCEFMKELNNSDTELKKMYLIRDIYDLLVILDGILEVMNYEGSLENIEDYKNKYKELNYDNYTFPSNNRNKVIRFFTKYPDLTTEETLDGIRSEILGIIKALGGNELLLLFQKSQSNSLPPP